MSDISCLSLRRQEETNYKGQIFFPFLHKFKKRFLLKFCVAMKHRETMKTVMDFIFLGSKITANGDWSHEIKKDS